MNQFSPDILLEFLYNKFAITFAFCFFGAFVKEFLSSRNAELKTKESKNSNSTTKKSKSKDSTVKDSKTKDSKNKDPKSKKSGKFNLGNVIISAIFSTFLMCAGADYINKDLHIEVYAVISIILGLWGMGIIKCIIDENFIRDFCSNLAKSITNPIVKSVVDSASKASENTNTDSTDDDTDNKDE